LLIFPAVIDGMEDISNWSIEKSEDANLSIKNVSGYSGDAIELNYDFGSSSTAWAQIRKDKYFDLTGGNCLSFYCKSSGDGNNLEFKVTDFNGDVFGLQNFYLLPEDAWRRINLSLEGLSYSLDYLWNDSEFGAGDGVLDRDKIVKIEFTITKNKGGKGSFYLDRFCLINSDEIIVDDFNDGSSPNVLSGEWGIMPSTESISTKFIEDSFEGKYALEVDYNVPSSWCGIWIFLDKERRGIDVSRTSYFSFFIKGDGRVKLEIKDEEGSFVYRYLNYASSLYKEYKIYLSSFSEIDFSKLKQINFVWENSTGVVKIDLLRFGSGEEDMVVSEIEGFEDSPDILPIYLYEEGENKASFFREEGIDGKCLKVDYSFKNGNWIAIQILPSWNFYKYDRISFYLKGEGEKNNFEVKIEDKDGTVFIRKFFSVLNFTDFRKISIPFDEFFYFSTTSDKKFDFKSVRKIWFTVSSNEGGSGRAVVDEVALEKEEGFKREGNILKNFKTSKPLISPDSDELDDSFVISFSVDEETDVKFEVFNLRGERVYLYENRFGKGSCSFEWKPGSAINNGVYIWVIEGKSSISEEIFKGLVGVER